MRRLLLPALAVVLSACEDTAVPTGTLPETSVSYSYGAGPASARSYALTDLGTLGGDASFALGINNRELIVGTARTTTASRPQLAFVSDGQEMVDLGTLAGSTFSRAFAVNQRGVAVGEAFTPDGASRAVLWHGGELVELAPGVGAVANDVNNRGRVVGSSGGSAVVWDGARMTSLGALSSDAAATSRANAVADNGRVVGTAQTDILNEHGLRTSHAFSWKSRRMIDLGTLGGSGSSSSALGVNARGEVVGEAAVGDDTFHAFRWRKRRMEDIHPEGLGIRHSRANDVNASGKIVGWASDFYGFPSFGAAAAVLWVDGVAIDLNTLVKDAAGWDLRAATGINDRGQIVGYGLLEGQTRAFLLTPK